MAQKYWFFNSAPGDPRTYQAADFARYFGEVLTSGLLSINGQMGLRVIVGTGMQVFVEPGKAIIKGYAYQNDANEPLTLDLPEPTTNRIDRIVLRLDLSNQNRFIKVFVKRGTVSAPPALQRDNTIYELSLARITTRANTATIIASDIVDERMDQSLAGVVNSMITVPTSQFQAQWDAWYNAAIPSFEQQWDAWYDGNVPLYEQQWEDFISQISTDSRIDIAFKTYEMTATTAGQTDFVIPLVTFNKDKDALTVFINSTYVPPSAYTITGRTLKLNEGKAVGTTLVAQIAKGIVSPPETYPAQAANIGIADVGNKFVSENVEGALEENATKIGILLDKTDDLKIAKTNKDANGIYTTVTYRRKADNSLYATSVLSGGTSPSYTTRTITYYESNGTTVRKTVTFTLSYDTDGVLISEV